MLGSLLRRRLRPENEPPGRDAHQHRAGFDVASTNGYDLALVPPTVVRIIPRDSGFDWGDASIGAGAALGVGARRHRRHAPARAPADPVTHGELTQGARRVIPTARPQSTKEER